MGHDGRRGDAVIAPVARVLGAVVSWLFRKVVPAAIEEIAEEVADRQSARPPPLPDRYSEMPMPLSAKNVELQREQARRAARAFPPKPPPRKPR